MAKEGKCSQCGNAVKIINKGKGFEDKEQEKAYYDVCDRIEEMLESLEPEDREDDDELQELYDQKRKLAKVGKTQYEQLGCRMCGCGLMKTVDGPMRGYGYLSIVTARGIDEGWGPIKPPTPDDIEEMRRYIIDPIAADKEEAERQECMPIEGIVYTRFTLWDDESQTVKVIGEWGKRP